jgi:hypothetical protein
MADYTAIKYNVPYSKAGSLKLITTFTSDGSDDDATFSSGIDSTYKEYLFIFNNIHPETDNVDFTVGFRDGSTAYDATKTTTHFYAYHNEGDTVAALGYSTGADLAQSTGFQQLAQDQGNGNDECCSGYLHLFDPSNTTFVKHFVANVSGYHKDDYMQNYYTAGYCNVTAAIDGVQFKYSSDEIQGGTIQMFGVL